MGIERLGPIVKTTMISTVVQNGEIAYCL